MYVCRIPHQHSPRNWMPYFSSLKICRCGEISFKFKGVPTTKPEAIKPSGRWRKHNIGSSKVIRRKVGTFVQSILSNFPQIDIAKRLVVGQEFYRRVLNYKSVCTNIWVIIKVESALSRLTARKCILTFTLRSLSQKYSEIQ